MRNILGIFAAALVILAAVSCEKNEVLPNNNTEGKVVTLKASINNGETKTSLGDKDGDSYPVLWSEGDAIAVIQGTNVYRFTLKDGVGKTSAAFQCESANGFDPTQSYKAFYPYSYVKKVESEIKYTIPTTQAYVANNFDNGAMPMVAEGSEQGMTFTHLIGALKLQLKGTKKIKKIELVSSRDISGEIYISETDPYVTNKTSLSFKYPSNYKWVTLDCGEGVQLNEGSATDFIIAVCKHSNLEFFTIIVTDTENNRRVLRYGLKAEITAGTILKMAPVTYDPQENEYIVVENGKNTYYGAGVKVAGSIWAPVNCGYEPMTSTDKGYQYGKFYQWGRKDGYGYSDSDASYFSICEVTETPPSDPVENTFYSKWTNSTLAQSDWKEDNDPCPSGWEIPSYEQMSNVIVNHGSLSHTVAYEKYRYGSYGVWCCGNNKYNDGLLAKVFFNKYGCLNMHTDKWSPNKVTRIDLNSKGYYWTTQKLSYLTFDSNQIKMLSSGTERAYLIRCVKKPDLVPSSN